MPDTPRERSCPRDSDWCGCGRFVGRDGAIEIEHYEMSETIASVDGECRRCLEAQDAA